MASRFSSGRARGNNSILWINSNFSGNIRMSEDYSDYVGIDHNQPSELLEITRLADLQKTAERIVLKLEADLKKAQEELKELAERKVPEEMERLGLTEVKTKNGLYVEIAEKVRCSLTVENRPRGLDWLEKNDLGSSIKSEVVVSFNRKQLEDARSLVAKLRDENKIAALERTVHHSTLDSILRERLEDGKEVPLDIFGVMRQRIAKVEV